MAKVNGFDKQELWGKSAYGYLQVCNNKLLIKERVQARPSAPFLGSEVMHIQDKSIVWCQNFSLSVQCKFMRFLNFYCWLFKTSNYEETISKKNNIHWQLSTIPNSSINFRNIVKSIYWRLFWSPFLDKPTTVFVAKGQRSDIVNAYDWFLTVNITL